MRTVEDPDAVDFGQVGDAYRFRKERRTDNPDDVDFGEVGDAY